MKDDKKRLFDGIGANSFSQLINILMQIIIVPIYIRSWGINLYGEWLILSTIPAYFLMTNIGFLSSTENIMAIEVSANNKKNALEAYQSTYVFLSGLVLVFILIAVIIFFYNPNIADILKIRLISENDINLIFIIFILTVVVNFYNGLIISGFRCEGSYAYVTWVNSIGKIIEIGVIIVSLANASTPLFLAIMVFIVRIFLFSFTYLRLRIMHPWIIFGISHSKKSVIKKMVSPSLSFLAYDLGNILKIQGTVTVVGLVLGPVAVVTLSVTRTLLGSIQQIIGIINKSISPEISFAFGANNYVKLKKLFSISLYLTISLLLLATIFLLIFGQFIIKEWTDNRVMVDSQFFYLMLFSCVLNVIWFANSILLVSTNNVERLAIINFILIFIMLIIIYTLAKYIGINIIPITYLIIDFVMVVLLRNFLYSKFNLDMRDIFSLNNIKITFNYDK